MHPHFLTLLKTAPNLRYLSSNFDSKSRQYQKRVPQECRKGGSAIISDQNAPWWQVRRNFTVNVLASRGSYRYTRFAWQACATVCQARIYPACHHSNFTPDFFMGRCHLTSSSMRSVSIPPGLGLQFWLWISQPTCDFFYLKKKVGVL